MPFYLTNKKSIEPLNCWQTVYVEKEKYFFTKHENCRKYEIDVSFSAILSIFEALENSTEDMKEFSIFLAYDSLLSEETKQQIAIYPNDFIGIQKFIENYVNPKEISDDKTEKELKIEAIKEKYLPRLTDQNVKSFDILKDSEYIYVSFLQDYTIDLIAERDNRSMTYERFKVLLLGLSENSKLMKIINLRQMELPKDMDKKAKEQIQNAKKAVSLGKNETLDLNEKRKLNEKMKKELEEVENGR